MDSWIVVIKFIALFYCVLRFVGGDMSNIPLVVLSMLIYISISTLSYLIRSAALRRIILIAASLYLVVTARRVEPFFMLLLPVNAVEIAMNYTDDQKVWLAAALIPAFLCDAALVPEYLLTALLSLIGIIIAFRSHASIKNLIKENEYLKEKIDALYGKLDMETEYENQLRYLSQLEERNSLAQRIHDRVGHVIAGSLIQLQAASLIISKDREKAGEIIDNVTQNLKEGMEGIRSALRNIKPAPEQLGINRLKAVLDEYSLKNSIRTELSHEGSLDMISHGHWLIITENMKEALTNSLKYSKATAVRVEIRVMNKLIRAEVRDNSIGVPGPFKKGLGIAGMEERTESAGGKLIIDSSDGFSVITLLPVGDVKI